MTQDTLKLTIGEKCYFDTFGGFLKCVVIDIKPTTHIDNLSGQTSGYNLTIKITTNNNPCYKHNEIVYTNSLHIIPRRCYHKTGIMRYTVYPDYIWFK